MITPEQYKEAEEKIRALFAKWRSIMGLDTWSLQFNYDYDEYPDNSADCNAQPEYEQAQITVRLVKLIKDYPDEADWEDMVVHELGHAICWSGSELEITRITKAVLRAHDYNLVEKPERSFL